MRIAKLQAIAVLVLISTSGFAQSATAVQPAGELIPDHLAYLYTPPPAGTATDAQHQLYAEKRRWENGRKLRVCFFNGNPVVARLVREIASEWNASSGVEFDFGAAGGWINCLSPAAGFPEIRIGFSERGYWSYVGSDSERYGGERAPSMNLDGFNRTYSEARLSPDVVTQQAAAYHKAAIRHEFGHALGLLHEHQNPALNCFDQVKWSGAGNAYEYFAQPPNEWSREQVDRNLGFAGVTDPDYVAGDPDPKSVMMYSLSASIFKGGTQSKCAVPVNYDLSDKDRQIVAKIYPKATPGQAIAQVSESVDAAYIRPVPQFAAAFDTQDYFKRAVADLESTDTATRRNARARLSQMVSEPQLSDDVSKLVLDVPNGSYRYKLGVASALGNADNTILISGGAATVLSTQLATATDQILRDALGAAQNNSVVR